MIFKDDESVLAYVELNSKKTPKWVESAREYSKTL